MYDKTASLLQQLETQLQAHKLWQAEPIDAHLLHSGQPFCVDTLRFEQWLQFVFIVKMRVLVQNRAVLPSSIALTPMAELQWPGRYLDLHKVLTALDQHLSHDAGGTYE
ncbi:YqcC family protein [Pseudoalteromonas sp. T1lg22]|uniref:YqcC family protein n=1 Tax=Pseudoalteromonas sp. T1lg22 TaxID=2077096 RepID=UPI000CF73B6E|nr:YqcC family protein [Pseudoalteromonas sp. T1lg22]